MRVDPLEAYSAVGSGDAFLAGYVAARYTGRPPAECLRFGVACGAESTQHIGAGVIDPREVDRLRVGRIAIEPVEMPPQRCLQARRYSASMEVEIGRGKKARRAYGFDDIAIVPSRRTRDPDDVDISWTLGPTIASSSRCSAPRSTASCRRRPPALSASSAGWPCSTSRASGRRYEDADEQLARIAQLPKDIATREMQDIYAEPVKPELIAAADRARSRTQGVVAAASLTPQKVRHYYEVALEAGLDILVIQGTVVSAEHVSSDEERPPLNLKEFIRELPIPVVVGGCASYHTGLHLMRTGAAGVLVGVGPGAICTTRGVLGIGVPAGDGDRRRGRGALAAHARDRRLRAR